MAIAPNLLLQDPLFSTGRRSAEPATPAGIVVVIDGTTTRLRFGDSQLVVRALAACDRLGIDARKARDTELREPLDAAEQARAARLICHLAPHLGLSGV